MAGSDTKGLETLIAIVLPNLAGGGAERVHLELAREFIDLGYTVEFVLLRREGALLAELPDTMSVAVLNVSNFRHVVMPLRRYLQERKPRFVISAMWPLTAMTIIAARTVRPRPRVLVGEHIDFVSGSREHRLSKLTMRFLGRALYSAADAVICVSDGVRAALAEITGMPADQFVTVFNPVRAPRHVPALPRTDDAAWWQTARYKLVTAGRLTEQKDHATLLRAMALLPQAMDARLLILGEGPEWGNLKGLIETLGLQDRVRMGGFTHAVPSFLKEASLLVMSSRWEGLPVILCEALLQGVPIVSTDCPSGPAEILDGDRFGRLVPVRDPAALAAAIVVELGTSRDREALIARGGLFSPRGAAERYLTLLDPAFNQHAFPATS
jgi:glycosyltransferase involved in cell wall biosynthesis